MKKIFYLLLILNTFELLAYDNSYGTNSYSYGNSENEYKYEGLSGTKYKYDLSDPSDRLDYQMDLDAQMDDSINPDPGIDLDRSIGEYGGGAEW